MAREKTQWYWVLDGTLAVSLLMQKGIDFKTRKTKRKNGIEIGVPERYALSAVELFSMTDNPFEGLFS